MLPVIISCKTYEKKLNIEQIENKERIQILHSSHKCNSLAVDKKPHHEILP